MDIKKVKEESGILKAEVKKKLKNLKNQNIMFLAS